LTTPPLLILAPPRSFTSVVSAMLGQHPDLYAFPETHLFVTDSVVDLQRLYATAGRRRQHGLLRLVAQLATGEQTPESIALARAWYWTRRSWSTSEVFLELASAVHPLAVVEKSVSTPWRREHLERAAKVVPQSRFLHLTRHPLPQCESLTQAFDHEPRLAHFVEGDHDGDLARAAERLWLEVHRNILAFLSSIPAERQLRVAGEDLLSEPEKVLTGIVGWLGVSSASNDVEKMLHPEASPFVGLGPVGARFGSDPKFLTRPEFRRGLPDIGRLDEALPWRGDGRRLADEVIELAKEFGYV
jgi:hypothetical protein